MTTTEDEKVFYTVVCGCCGSTWEPGIGSALWWKAHKKSEKGYLDAYMTTGIECGCEKKAPEAPYVISGYTWDCVDYVITCKTFVEAVRIYKERYHSPDVVFITGISEAVRQRIEYGV